MNVFIGDGNTIDHTPTAAVAAGEVIVQGSLVGVAKTPIAANTLGALAVTGIFRFAKATGSGTMIPVGTPCFWDVASARATATATGNQLIGKSVAGASISDATVLIRLSQ